MTREKAEELVVNEIAERGHGIIGKEVTFSDELHDNLFQYAIDLRMKGPVWTSEKPTQPGWYWYDKGNGASIEDVTRSLTGELIAYTTQTWEDASMLVSEMNGLWAGPLNPPE